MSPLPLRVVKLGGSLLELAALANRLEAWRSQQAPGDNVLIVGGGRQAELIREADRIHGLGQERSHWLAVQAMGLNADLMLGVLHDAVPVADLREVAALRGRKRWLVADPLPFLERAEKEGRIAPLPHTWDVTSDSIAAWLASFCQADELVLLKSALPIESSDLDALAASGYVDAHFPQAGRTLRQVRCVDLRRPDFPTTWIAGGPSEA